MSLVECVPNISEGRRQDLIDAIAAAIRAVPGLRLLDYSMDSAHHRAVYSFAGPPEAVAEGALTLAERAIAAIDLREHHGVHPRVGAVDVVPIIPLADSSMAECVTLARWIGQAIAERWSIPVYLYEAAATRPERAHLENIRRGEFEGLAAKMARPEWRPDFGPAHPHPTAGATVVGARRALIAFNVNLASDRVEVAKRIAAAVRQSSGGLPFVKALGLPLADRGIVQVSMNLTNYERTPIQDVFDRVSAEAKRLGVSIVESELIGLIPEAALAATSPANLLLRNFSDDHILEHRLGEP